MSGFSKWIEQLHEPLVLVGFVIMLVTGIISLLLKKDIFHLPKSAAEKIINQVLKYAFILGLITIVLGFALAFKREPVKEVGIPNKIEQKTEGGQSPAVVSGGDVKIQYDKKR